MSSRVFISQNDNTGRGAAKKIYDKLTGPASDMDIFLSTTLPVGVDFVEAIMAELPYTDVQFFVIDSETRNSKWMKWEHDFCKKRNIQIVYVKYPHANLDDPALEYINQQSIRIVYEGYRDDILLDRIEEAVTNLGEKAKRRSQARASISIRPDQSPLRGKPSEPVTVSGSISGCAHNNGRVYLHVPNTNSGIPPDSTHVSAFAIGADGKFSCELKLPGVRPGATRLVWYAEIRAEPAACVVPIRVDAGKTLAQRGVAPSDAGSSVDGDMAMPDQMQHYSKGVLGATPRDIGSWEFPRPEVGEIHSLLDREDRVVLTGDKGSGKTVVLCQLYEKLAGTRRVLLVRCDDFLQPSSLDDLDRTIGGGASVLDYLAGARGGGTKTVLLLDSLDAVSRNAESMSLFRRFIQSAWSTGNEASQ